MLLALALLLSPLPTNAANRQAAAQPFSAALVQHDGVLSLADGSLTLAAHTAPPPAIIAGYTRYGLAVGAPIALQSAARLQITYQATTPGQTSVRVDLRASPDGRTWLPWQTDLPTGAVVDFRRPMRFAQYRLTLLGSADAAPMVAAPTVRSSSATAQYEAAATDPYAIAPTYRVRATRQGMIGGRTANGYIIPPKARFVSLPCWCSLSTRGGDEYQVRLTYNGRSTVVPVYDVGPYSGRDDYWDTRRDGFPELERGWPQDHAAYYEGHNGGRADKAYVRFPTAVDVGDGAWWDDLGINGDQAELEITFLWMGQDPLAGPPQRSPDQGEHTVDELGGDFWHTAVRFTPSPVGCGQGRHAYSTLTTSDPARSTHIARWQPRLPIAGMYDLYVHVPICPGRRPPTTNAVYVIQHRDGALEVPVNQATQTGWVYLGRYPFNADNSGFIQLSDVSSAPGATLWFDQARWVRAP